MSAPDLGAWLRRAQEVQTRLAALQRELARRTVDGSSGGGLVVATATGELRILRIAIDPQLFASQDREMLQDLVAAAVNAALAEAQRVVQEEMQRAASALQVPAGGQGPGPGAE
jgi:DNA-binding YbaB/EbfC family protein